MKKSTLTVAAASAVVALAGAAQAQTVTLTGPQDFSIHQIGEGVGGFLPPVIRRDVVDGRFQVNGRNPDPSNRLFGQWTAINVDTSTAFSGPVDQLERLTLTIGGAETRPDSTAQLYPILFAGTMSIYLTTDGDDNLLDAANGYDWIDDSPNGIGDQFSDLFLLDTRTFATGQAGVDPTPSWSVDVDLAALGSVILDQINSGSTFRFIITGIDDSVASSWYSGVENERTSPVTNLYTGVAPTVEFVIPAPGAMGLLAGMGLLAARRRR
ncbi:MAG: hypothetical protein EA378_10495 [Phycisphaerales bacterium]|nr:MAG: hypothetical protein EA378_10495 [Phycisphaerales bacterium]